MSIRNEIERYGRFPPVELRIKPLASPDNVVVLRNFLSYQYDSSLLVPVDTFSFTYAVPDDKRIWSDYFREGDIAQLYANNQVLATGIIDQIEYEVDAEFGEKITITGRDLMGQLEDQDAVSIDSTTIFGSRMTITGVYNALKVNTRIPALRLQDAPAGSYLFATEPGESKLAALMRFIEPLNVIAWMDPDGGLRIGRPNMAQPATNQIVVDRENRRSNCAGIKFTFASATVPNIIVPVWAGQEIVQSRVGVEQALKNKAEGPARLLSLNHRLPKCVVVSNPQGTDPQGFADVNRFRAGGSNILQAYAKREIARQNIKELSVQVVMPGHVDGDGNPFRVDTTFSVNTPRATRVPIELYCYQAQYKMDLDKGQMTNLFFTKKGTIVSDVKVQ